MDFNLANQYAADFKQSGNEELHKKLVSISTPYLLGLKNRFGFLSIPNEEVKDELASDAVSDAIMKYCGKIPFRFLLQNTFRDICRKRVRIRREYDSNQILTQFDLKEPSPLMSSNTPPTCPSTESQDSELVEKANDILANHDPFSKKVVYQKVRGSTYPDMSNLFKKTLNECKRVYWHDIDVLRIILNQDPPKD